MSLNNHHLAVLAASGISEQFALARGYETITDPKRLANLVNGKGITRVGRSVPGLLVPMLRKDGSTWGYQYRPDNPRRDSNGKSRKYETPRDQRNGLDFPPGVAAMMADPSVALWVTEGCKKADCAALQGLCVVALSGVWNWITTSTAGGKMALPEWADCGLNGRRVIIAFDSDTARIDNVQKAMRGLANYLATKGARIEYLHLPDAPGQKTGLDDYLVNHSVADLMKLVKPTQPPPTQPQQQPAPPKPPPPAFGTIDGAKLLDDVDTYLGDYVIYPTEHMRRAHALWCAHAHLMECWESTPRIAFLSPEPQSGKTRALEVTEPLVPRPVHAVNTTSAYLFRKVSDPAGLPTILYDEIDTVFGPKAKENEEVRGMLNAGHRKGAVAGRCVTKGDKIETEELPAYCALAIAGLDDLPDTIMTRAIVVRMKPRARTEKVKPWRLRTDMPRGLALGERLAKWAESVQAQAAASWPAMPAGIEDRDADVWEALLQVADMAGGHWPQTARDAAVAAVADPQRKVPTLGLLLLQDIRDLFYPPDAQAAWQTPPTHLWTIDILTDLQGVEESPWGSIRRDGKGIDSRGLAQRLKRYGIGSANIRGPHNSVGKGYFRKDFEDAWARYLPPLPNVAAATAATASATSATASTAPTPSTTPGKSATSATSATPQVSDPIFVADEPKTSATAQFFAATGIFAPPDPSTNGARLCRTCHTQKLIRPESIARGVCAECALKNPEPKKGATP